MALVVWTATIPLHQRTAADSDTPIYSTPPTLTTRFSCINWDMELYKSIENLPQSKQITGAVFCVCKIRRNPNCCSVKKGKYESILNCSSGEPPVTLTPVASSFICFLPPKAQYTTFHDLCNASLSFLVSGQCFPEPCSVPFTAT
jgi:hypothetical protein